MNNITLASVRVVFLLHAACVRYIPYPLRISQYLSASEGARLKFPVGNAVCRSFRPRDPSERRAPVLSVIKYLADCYL